MSSPVEILIAIIDTTIHTIADHHIFQILFSLSSVVLHIVDIGTDVSSGVHYLQSGNTWWGILTLCFAGAGLIVSNLVSIWQYVNKKEFDEKVSIRKMNFNLLKNPWKTIYILLLILQLGALFMWVNILLF